MYFPGYSNDSWRYVACESYSLVKGQENQTLPTSDKNPGGRKNASRSYKSSEFPVQQRRDFFYPAVSAKL
jgi:hypothetical protein